MRTVERQGLAWRSLLKLVEEQAVQITFRGFNDQLQPLYEVKTRDQVIALADTEREIIGKLEVAGETK